MTSIMLYTSWAQRRHDRALLCRDFFESLWREIDINGIGQYSISGAKTVTYTFHLGIKKEITDFMRMRMEDQWSRYFVGT